MKKYGNGRLIKSMNWRLSTRPVRTNISSCRDWFPYNPHTPFIAPQEYFDKYPIETLQLTPRIADDVEDTYFDKNVKITQSTLHVYQSLIDSIERLLRMELSIRVKKTS